MKKIIKNIIIILSLVLIVGCSKNEDISINIKNKTVNINDEFTLKLNTKNKVAASASNKNITITRINKYSFKVKAIKKGKSKALLKYNNKTYNCNIIINEKTEVKEVSENRNSVNEDTQSSEVKKETQTNKKSSEEKVTQSQKSNTINKNTPSHSNTSNNTTNNQVNNNVSESPKETVVEKKAFTLTIDGAGNRIKSMKVDYFDNATPYSLLLKSGLSVEGSSFYVKGIAGLKEKDKGPSSGWMYSVNGVTPMKMAGAYKLKEGDNVRWYYVNYN